MNTSRSLIVVAFAAVVLAACQATPPEGNDMTNEAESTPAAEASNATADSAAAEGSQEARPERPQPDAPRAEGDQLAEFIASTDVLFLDVRRPDEIEELGTVDGYLNIPIEELADRLDEVPRTKPILTA